MFTPLKYKKTLINLIRNAASHPTSFVNNPDKDMTRNRKCTFENTVRLILGFENSTLKTEISRFFSNAKDRVAKSSFVKQRKKINGIFFPWLFDSFTKTIPRTKKFKGLFVCCCDGSDINLPTLKEDTENFVKYPSKNGGYYQKHLNALYDPLNKLFLDLVIQPRPVFQEASALCEMVRRYDNTEPTVFLADRGYPSYNLIATIMEKKQFFLIRAKDLRSPTSFLKHITFPAEGEFDIDVTLGLTRSRKKKYRKHPEFYKVLHKKRRFDFIAENDYETVYVISFRVVCVEIGNGVFEYLLTNLPRNKFDKAALKDLYRIRWGIETAFRYIKYAFCMVYFHSRNRSFIDQEIYARLIVYNFTSAIHSIAEKSLEKQKPSPKRKWEQKISFEAAAETARQFLKTSMNNKIIIALLLTNKSPVRPGRKFGRQIRSQSAKSLNNRA